MGFCRKIYNSRLTNYVERVFLINVYNLYIIIYRAKSEVKKQVEKVKKFVKKVIKQIFCAILYMGIKFAKIQKLHYI